MSLKWFHSSNTFNYYLLVVCSLQMYNQRDQQEVSSYYWYFSNAVSFDTYHLFEIFINFHVCIFSCVFCLFCIITLHFCLFFGDLLKEGFMTAYNNNKNERNIINATTTTTNHKEMSWDKEMTSKMWNAYKKVFKCFLCWLYFFSHCPKKKIRNQKVSIYKEINKRKELFLMQILVRNAINQQLKWIYVNTYLTP